jgi:DNA-binding NarL/FixJ family response regulator
VAVRVVLVEDEPMFLEALRALLAADDRVEVVGTAANGEDALGIVDAQHPDVALVDLRLPRMDGYETTRRLIARAPSLKVIAVSGLGDEGAPVAAIAAGATQFLLKGGLHAEIADAIVAASEALTE